MKKFNRAIGVLMVIVLAFSLAACGGGKNEGASNTPPATDTPNNSADNKGTEATLDYQFGEDQTFHSDEPVTYSMMYSDHENYPYQKDWRLWSSIKEKTNVSFDLSLTARTEYDNQKALIINSGDAPYIIPKTYDETPFVAGGQIVPISDYVQYMPNYMKAVKDWGLEADLKSKLQADGKYYVLPGMWEGAGSGYSYAIRKDVFEAAGVDVAAQEGNWTYEDFYEALKKVKEYTGAKYVFSDAFKGDSSLNIAAVEYGVTAGWGKANGLKFDEDKKEFYFADASEDYKAFVTYFNKLIKEGLMDPESFTQEDDQAQAKFFKGDSYVINANYQLMVDYQAKMQDPNAELYMIVQPGGPKGLLQVENSRLENGIMISQNALNDLGEEKFIKMLRFVDWLWYSDEGQTLSLWGVEGETYTKDADGTIVLNPDITYNGINPTAPKKLNVDFGFGGGVFAYGGSNDLRWSKFTDGEKDYYNRIFKYRQPRPIQPPIMATADQSEQMNMISTPLMDYISTMTLKFITGQEPLTNWDNFVSTTEANGSTNYTQMANEVFNNTKSILGY
ncbi:MULTISPECIES: sugar ABC transporter substrate-binding protein [unclassified Paenibacillus]|uniref:ABC transporter substrate-binding protein n=1 Tax=unclassified Paenibacillus TaxID=185978 RepID=UPI00083860CE|nr:MULTISPECIES: sugar ABC transporter substrate-binding protein [unclassified Paenibacillus]NWL86635.1 sugar ABC transporter substrate-binding protein [Paenibacillus sp. 79R4]